MAIKSDINDVRRAGNIMSMGAVLPFSLLSIATVVGIIETDAAFITTKRTISLEAVKSFMLDSSFSRDIASRPKGVAALPRPNMFAVIFIDIAFIAGEFFFNLGNNNRKIGDSARLIIFVRPDFSATFIIPLQKAITPISFKHSVIAGCPPLIIDAESAFILPKANAEKTESVTIITKI